MWKVIRTCDFGLIGEDEFYTFEEAKMQFRYIIKNKLGDGIFKFTEQIDAYCKEFYPDGAPEAFDNLKEVLIKLATDPNYPENPESFEMEEFSDDNIEFYYNPRCKDIFIYVNNDEVKEKFPQAEINVILMEEPDDEYFFFITDNRNGFDGEHYYTNITLKNADSVDDEEDVFDFDDDLDDEE